MYICISCHESNSVQNICIVLKRSFYFSIKMHLGYILINFQYYDINAAKKIPTLPGLPVYQSSFSFCLSYNFLTVKFLEKSAQNK